jgi:prepilin-type N-terminal cleavage/methylation domain-containing protein
MTSARVPGTRWRSVGSRLGFTLVEAIVALVVCGIVSTVLYRTLVGGQRLHRSHLQSVAVSESNRAALAILAAELRELSAGEGDILAMDSVSITFKSMQAFHVQCAAPDTAAARILLDGAAASGLRPIGAPEDSVLLFAENDPATRLDDGWLSASAASVTAGTLCPGGRSGLAVMLSGVSAARLAGVQAGAPVRGFRPTQVLTYQDAGRDWWLGQRQFQPSSGSWTVVQPVLGPLSADGLTLTYLDAAGSPTDSAAAVARVGLRVRSRSPERVYRSTGATYLLDDVMTHVAVRNNPRY